MDQLLQFLLFAAFTACIYSYSIDRRMEQSEPDPPEFQDPEYYGYGNNINYPAEYINKLIESLSPEELKMLKIDRNDVEDRIDNDTSSSKFCSWYHHDYIPTTALPAADRSRTAYIVVNSPKFVQKFPIQVCDSKNENRCFENATEIVNPGSKGCCLRKEEAIEMQVLAVPAKYFNKNIIYPIVKKKMYLKTKCSCENIEVDLQNDGKCESFYISY